MEIELDERDILVLAGCSLAKTPGVKDSWIEAVGGEIPEYICRVAKNLVARGYTISHAIATAVNTIKRWARGGTSSKSGPRAKAVHADTQAKAAKALAEWEALKAKADLTMTKLAEFDEYGNTEIVSLCDYDYSIDEVRKVYEAQNNKQGDLISTYVVEAWTHHLVVQRFDGETEMFWHVPYFVTEGQVTFGDPIEVEKAFLPKDLDEEKLAQIADQVSDEIEVSDSDSSEIRTLPRADMDD